MLDVGRISGDARSTGYAAALGVPEAPLPPPKFQALGVPEASLGGCSATDPQQAAAERGFSQRRPPVGRLCRTAAPQQKAARGPVAGGMRSAPRLCVLRGALGVRCSPQGARGVLCGARGEWRAATL